MKAADRGSKVTQPPLGSSINLIESGFSWTRILIEEKKKKNERGKSVKGNEDERKHLRAFSNTTRMRGR